MHNFPFKRWQIVTVPAALLGSALLGTLGLSAAPAAVQATKTAMAKPTRVAIFTQHNFPVYGFFTGVSPQQIARDLKLAGIETDLLDTDTLAKSDQFNAKKYSTLILLDSNTYPLEAYANMQQFHRDGGSFILTGIPFTHGAGRFAVRDWSANPGWGLNAQQLVGAGPNGGNAFQITGRNEDWSGVTSARLPVKEEDKVDVSLQVKSASRVQRLGRVPNRPQRRGNGTVVSDDVYIRFFDANGNYIEQGGTTLNVTGSTWQKVSATATAPTNAIAADISVQVARNGQQYLVSDFQVQVNGKTVALPNGDLSQQSREQFVDIGHSDTTARWGTDGIGVGGFAGPDKVGPPAPATLPADDPLKLKGIFTTVARPSPAPQWVDVQGLPKGVEVIPTIGDKKRPLASLIVHKGDQFAGAVDAWVFHGLVPEREEYESRQIITRSTVASLVKRGLMTPAQQAVAFRKFAASHPPKVYSNIALPQIPRQYETFQPKMGPPAEHLYVADITRLNPDERLLLTSLQGVVNRKQPRIYLIFDSDDQPWLDEMQKQQATKEPIRVADPFSLLQTFKSEYKGVVVCDPKIYDSPCVAVSMAGADDVIVAKTAELAQRFELPVATDLRGKFKDNGEALRFIHTDLLPKLDPYLTCSLNPSKYDIGAVDSIIAARGSTFWITGPRAQDLPGATQFEEMDEVRTLFTKMPLGAVVRGFWWAGDGIGLQEEAGVAMGSRFGKITLVSDLITNLSVHSGITATTLTQRPHAPAPPLDPTKTYVAFTMSDGDNLVTWRGYFRRYFNDPVRGTIPVGWGMGPTLIDMAPDWARWYYEAASPNDEFICDVSGVAYIYPPDWAKSLKDRDAAMHVFYDQTQDYMNRMDMKTLRLMNVDAASIAEVGKLLPKVNFLMPDYGRQNLTDYKQLTYTLPTGQSVFRAVTSGSGPKNLADQIRQYSGKGRPAFVNAFIWNWGSNLGDLKKVMEELGPDYVAVLPSQLDTLYREANNKDKAPKVTATVKP